MVNIFAGLAILEYQGRDWMALLKDMVDMNRGNHFAVADRDCRNRAVLVVAHRKGHLPACHMGLETAIHIALVQLLQSVRVWPIEVRS